MNDTTLNSIDSTVDSIVSTLAKLNGLPGYALVTLACLVFGYLLKALPRFPNGGIPLAVVMAGAVLNGLIAEVDAVPFRIWIVKNAIVGGVCGFIAFLSHHLVISRIEDRVKRLLGAAPLIAVLAAGLALSGCATVSPGSDPVVVNAERTLATSFEVVDAFLLLEYKNRDVVMSRAPYVHALAEDIRQTAPGVFKSASIAVRAYKRSRTPAARLDLQKFVADAEHVTARASLATSTVKLLTQ
jgi:hypothetical protein